MKTFIANIDRVTDMFRRRIEAAADNIESEIIQAHETTVVMSHLSEKVKPIPARVAFTLDIFIGDDGKPIFCHVLKVGHNCTKNHGKCEEHNDDTPDMFEAKK